MDGHAGESGGESAGEIASAIRAADHNVVVNQFGVEPHVILSGQGVTVFWDVTFGETTSGRLLLNGKNVPLFGEESFTLTQSTTFRLSVDFRDGTKINVASDDVRVDPFGCKIINIDPSVIISLVKSEIDARFRGAGPLALDDNGSIVTLDNNQIKIVVPAEIAVPNWFDADLDLAIKLSVGPSFVSEDEPILIR